MLWPWMSGMHAGIVYRVAAGQASAELASAGRLGACQDAFYALASLLAPSAQWEELAILLLAVLPVNAGHPAIHSRPHGLQNASDCIDGTTAPARWMTGQQQPACRGSMQSGDADATAATPRLPRHGCSGDADAAVAVRGSQHVGPWPHGFIHGQAAWLHARAGLMHGLCMRSQAIHSLRCAYTPTRQHAGHGAYGQHWVLTTACWR